MVYDNEWENMTVQRYPRNNLDPGWGQTLLPDDDDDDEEEVLLLMMTMMMMSPQTKPVFIGVWSSLGRIPYWSLHSLSIYGF